MNGLVITFSETINNDHHVIGTLENKPFEMYYDTDQASGTVDGDFTDEERLQILTGWEMRQ